jgi:hypothetical protein
MGVFTCIFPICKLQALGRAFRACTSYPANVMAEWRLNDPHTRANSGVKLLGEYKEERA